MKRFRWPLRPVFAFLRSGTVVTVIMLGGCKEKGDIDQELFFNLAISDLTGIAEKHEGSDLGERAKVALSRLRNGVCDPEPVLMRALIGFPEPNEAALTLLYLDEDRDLRGLRVREQHVDPNGRTTILEEDYPVYVNTLKSLIFEPPLFPVQIRDKQQRKDEFLWLQYANRCLDELVRSCVDQELPNNIDLVVVQPPEVEMPKTYISLPDPNSVRVFVSVYDRAGHESGKIELLRPPFMP